MGNHTITLAPMLYLKDLAAAIEFYTNAFDAVEQWHISNPDGSIHVAEMTIGTALFRMHEEMGGDNNLSPDTAKGTTIVLGLQVPDPDVVAAKAEAAGGTILSPVKDYDYGYRQGMIKDPFGHHWQVERTPAGPPLGAK